MTLKMIGRLPLLAILFAVSAHAADVWRMAGTFNSWNTLDDGWTLTPVNGEQETFELRRVIEPGTYRFKFVRNGGWAMGHLGSDGDGSLVQPGNDVLLRIRALAAYRITLDAEGRTWGIEVAHVDTPMLFAAVRGTPEVDREFMLDLRDSLIGDGEIRISIASPDQPLGLRQDPERPMCYLVTPTREGELRLDITASAGETTITERVETTVGMPHTFELVLEGDEQPRFAGDLLALPDGTSRAIVTIVAPTTITSLTVRRGEDPLIQTRNEAVAAGTYAIEVRDGTVVTSDDDDSPMCLIPGNWRTLQFMPASGERIPVRVHAFGDFNRWGMPGSPTEIELASVKDGSFRTFVDMPEGAHRYQFLLDGDVRVPDPTVERTVLDSQNRPLSIIVVGPTPDDLPAARANHINFNALLHDQQRDVVSISDQMGLVELSLRTLPNDVDSAYVQFELPGEGIRSRGVAAMRRTTDLAGFDRWTARLMTGSPDLVYAFELKSGYEEFISKDYTATLEPDPLQIPDWAKGAVWYQIFTERFRNGNPLNDPHGDDVFPMPWNAHWYRAAPGEEKEHRRRNNVGPDHVWDPVFPHDNLFHWVWNRRYGGDLQGVVEKLDELQALGVTAIYFNPIFEGESMHKYDATDFRHIDDNFGTPAESGRVPQDFTPPASNTDDPMTWTWTAADRYFVDVLIPEAHKRGIRVVIDGVFNHTGRDFWAFEDVVANGTDSPYADWFFAEFDDDGALESWVAWDGPSGWLPKFMQKPNRDLVDPVKKHMFDITTRWMDPNGDGDPSDGIDGWRLDVALDVGLPFWEDWRAHVKSINPDAIIIAEIWSEADQYLQGQHFDTQMHYPFASAVVDWLAVQPGMSSDELGSRLQDAFNESPQTNLIHQNLFASHDTDRYVSMLYNPNRGYDQGNRIQDGDDYKDTRPSRDIYDLSLLGVAIQATYLGAPMIYYGDEYGMWGADDPTDRKPVPWPDTPRNLNPDDRADLRIRSAYREWFNLRHDPRIGPVLRYGDVQHVSTGDPGVFAFDRSLNGRAVRVIVNRNDRAYDATHLLPDGSRGKRMAPVSARWWVISGD